MPIALQRLRFDAFHRQGGLCCYCCGRMWHASPAELPAPLHGAHPGKRPNYDALPSTCSRATRAVPTRPPTSPLPACAATWCATGSSPAIGRPVRQNHCCTSNASRGRCSPEAGIGAGRTKSSKLMAASINCRRPKQIRHCCETKSVTSPFMTTAGQPNPSNDAGFQGLRSKDVTSQSMPTQRSKVVTTLLMV